MNELPSELTDNNINGQCFESDFKINYL